MERKCSPLEESWKISLGIWPLDHTLRMGNQSFKNYLCTCKITEKLQEQIQLYIQNFPFLLAGHILSNLVFVTDFKTLFPLIDSKLSENVISWIFSFGFTFERTLFYSLISIENLNINITLKETLGSLNGVLLCCLLKRLLIIELFGWETHRTC